MEPAGGLEPPSADDNSAALPLSYAGTARRIARGSRQRTEGYTRLLSFPSLLTYLDPSTRRHIRAAEPRLLKPGLTISRARTCAERAMISDAERHGISDA
jgi:hypothetical protein